MTEEVEEFDPTEPAPSPVGKASATVAPTSGKTLGVKDIAKIAKGDLSDSEFDFINLIHMHYRTNGVLCGSELAQQLWTISIHDYEQFINSDRVKTALVERGIPLEKQIASPDEKWRHLALSAEQIFVADVMLDLTDNRSYKKKLQDLKVSTSRWEAWIREPAFAEYLDSQMSTVIRNSQHEVALALMDKVRMGDLGAIKFHMEYTGRFVEKAKQTVGNENADLFNARQLVNDLIEIIIDEVDDHETVARVADRLKGLMQRNAIVGALIEPAAEPEVLPTRELTEKQQGVGLQI